MAKIRKTKKKLNHRAKVILIMSVPLLLILSMTLTIGKYWIEIANKYNEKKDLEQELASLKEKEKELQLDADKLQNSEYIARYAREKYLYSKEGEFIIKISGDD